MPDQKRGDDAADHAPRPKEGIDGKTPQVPEKQDGPNYNKITDGGRAMKDEDLSSANDE